MTHLAERFLPLYERAMAAPGRPSGLNPDSRAEARR